MEKIKKQIIRNSSNVNRYPVAGESYKGVVPIAVPNEAYTIKELFEKHTRGQMLPPIGKNVTYPDTVSHESLDYEELSRADLVDQEYYGREFTNIIEKANKQETARKKKAADQAEKNRLQKLVEDEIKVRAEKSGKEGSKKGGTNDE